MKNISYLLANLTPHLRLIPDEEKPKIINGIIESCNELMGKIITSKSPKKRARALLKPYKQSQRTITRDTIFFNIISGEQELPAEPKDFRDNLNEEEKNIGRSELSDILSFMEDEGILINKKDKLSSRRGRPTVEDRDKLRGSYSRYEPSLKKQLIEEILHDLEMVKALDNAIIGSELFYRFLKYTFVVNFYQLRDNEKAFLKGIQPAIKKYGIREVSTDETGNYVSLRDLNDDELKKLAQKYATYYMKNVNQGDKTFVYSVAIMYYLSATNL